MADRARPLISLIVPTRARVEKLRQFLHSLAATTAKPDRVEVILVADQDDPQTLAFRDPAMTFKMVPVPPGQTMSALNRAGYAASGGDFIMLVNDDVIVRTRAWDERVVEVFRTFPDGIVLVHVNDTIFGDKLCTFPFLTRAYCEIAGGICPEDYTRYRIDDHIYNVFNLLAVLGRKRIVYLPDIVFEHTNAGAGAGTDRYVPVPEIHASDTQHFDRLLASRKKLAIKLAASIDRHLSSQLADTRRKLLARIEDSVALRKPEFVTVRGETGVLSSRNARVTIGVVSADIRNPHARTCLEAIKQHTTNYDLIVLDNNFGPDFNHPREMNRILSICRTEFLVLMDDDVFVNPGWLDNMLRCMTPQVGVVTPMHMDRDGELSYAGIIMRPDNSGNHAHSLLIPREPEPVQSICSAVMLIDMARCGHLRVDESYSKYFLDIDYGLRVWESGCEVVVSPYSLVTHLGGATMQWQEPGLMDDLFIAQRAHFVREWIVSGRYRKLERKVWKNVPAILNAQASVGGSKVQRVRRHGMAADALQAGAPHEKASIDSIDPEAVPVLMYMAHKVVRYLGRFWGLPQALGRVNLEDEAERKRAGVIVRKTLAEVMATIDHVVPKDEIVQVQEGYKAHNIVRYQGRFWGLPQALGHVNLEDEAERKRPEIIVADALAEVRDAIDRVGPKDKIVQVQEGYKAHNIVRYQGRFWGLPLALGPVNLEDEAQRQRPGVIVKKTLAEVMAAIDRVGPNDEIVRVQEGYKAHNIVHYLGRFWGLPQALGKVNLKDEAERKRPEVIVADTFPGVRTAIDLVGRKHEVLLVQDGYKAHNIVRYLGRCWGLPKALGHVNLEDETERQRPGVVVADTLAELRDAIDRIGPQDEIVQLQEEYKAHNIVRYLGRFWGLPQALGHVNLKEEADQKRPGVIVADTLAEARDAIDSIGPEDEIVQVQEGYKEHNIVRYQGRFWGLPQALGPVNLKEEADQKRPGVIVADTLAKVRKAVDRVAIALEPSASPEASVASPDPTPN